MRFDNRSDFELLLEELAYRDSVFNLDTNLINEDTAYLLLENDLSFSSLRAEIASEIEALEAAENLWTYNDPDDHFIFSDEMRTILNPNLEVCIADTIAVYINEYTLLLIADDWNALEEARNGSYLEIISRPNVYLEQLGFPEWGILTAAFSYEITNRTVEFTDRSNDADAWYWVFGDLSVSSSQNPTHTYDSYGIYAVTMVVKHELPDGIHLYCEVTKEIDLTTCNASFAVISDHLLTVLTDYSIPAPGGNSIVSWNIDWGDGNTTYVHSPNVLSTVSHIYDAPGYYWVCMTISDDTECIDVYCPDEPIKAWSYTCLWQKKVGDFDFYDNGNYRIKWKAKLQHSDFFFVSKIMAKTLHYKRRNNGSWWYKRADEISTKINGYVVKGRDCSQLEYLMDAYSFSPEAKRRKAKAEKSFFPYDYAVTSDYLEITHYARMGSSSITKQYYFEDELD